MARIARSNSDTDQPWNHAEDWAGLQIVITALGLISNAQSKDDAHIRAELPLITFGIYCPYVFEAMTNYSKRGIKDARRHLRIPGYDY